MTITELPHSLSGQRALGPLNYAKYDPAGGVPGDPPGDRLYGCIQSRLQSLLDGTITVLILPARSTFTQYFLTWRGGISPATGLREDGFRAVVDEAVKRRIMSDQFVTLACQADPELALVQVRADAVEDGQPVVWVQDDMCLFKLKRGQICQTVGRAFSFSSPPGTQPRVESDVVFDFVTEDIEQAVELQPTGPKASQLHQALSLWDDELHQDGRKRFLEEHPLLAGLASRHLAVLHKHVNHACLGSSVPLLEWAPLAESTTVRADSFSALLFDMESWHWIDTTAAANAGAGRRDYQLFPQGELARRIREALGETSAIVDFLVIHLSVSERVFRCDFNLTPIVRLKPLKRSAVEAWLSKVMGRSVEEMMADRGDDADEMVAYRNRVAKEAAQLIAYALSRRVFRAIHDYIEYRRPAWEILPEADKTAIVPVEDRDYGQFLLGERLYSLAQNWLEPADGDGFDTLARTGLVSNDEPGWEGRPLWHYFPERGQVDHGYLGDFLEYDAGLSVYDLLMGWCGRSWRMRARPDLDESDYDRGHLPWPVEGREEKLPCDNQFCKDWQKGVLLRDSDKAMTLGEVKAHLEEKAKQEEIEQHLEAVMKLSLSTHRLRLHLMVLAAVGFAVPTVIIRALGEDEAMVVEAVNRGESGQKFFTSPLGGQWALGRLTSLQDSHLE